MVAFAALMLGWIPLRWGATVGKGAADRIAAGLRGSKRMSALCCGMGLPMNHGLEARATLIVLGALSSYRPMSGVVMGLYWGLLPCGLVWLFLARAAAAGSAVGGAAVMMVFGAGTVPALLVLGGLAGLIQGASWLNGEAFYRTIPPMTVYLILRAVSGMAILTGLVLMAFNVFATLWLPARASSENEETDRKKSRAAAGGSVKSSMKDAAHE